MICSIRGPKWIIAFSEIRLPEASDQLTVARDRKKGESFACSTGHALSANHALALRVVSGLTTNNTNNTK